MRVFLDTNVLVSAFAARGLCAELFELVLLEHDLILGRSVLQELAKALKQKFKLPARHTAATQPFWKMRRRSSSNRPIPQTSLSIATMQSFSEMQWQGMRKYL